MKYIKEKIKGSILNLKNWGVSDYTDKGDFDSAYSSARKAGEKEFMWNNKRYSTDIPNSNMINKYIANNIYPYGYWNTPKSKFKIDYDELMNLKYYNNGIYTTDKKLNIDDIKKITRNEKGESAYDLYRSKGKSSSPGYPKDLDASYDALSIFNNQPQKHNSFIESKYKPSDSKNPNMKYYSFNDKYSKQIEDDLFLYNNRGFINDKKNKRQVTGSIIAGASLKDYQYSKGKDDRGDYIAYYDINDYGNILDVIPNTNPFEIYGRIYYKDYNGQNKRMYYSDKELSELDVNKKNFDTLALQRELSNRGYKLPKSTKSDGTFDGIWGDEIKNALLDYQINNYAEGGKLNNHTNINMKFKEETKKFKKGGKSSKEIKEKASRKERKYQKRSDAFNSALQNIENLRASGASASEIGVAQGNLGRLQNRLGADGLNRLREEQRTQAIARDVANTQAREAVQAARGSFGSYRSPQVNVVMPTRTAQIAPVPQITIQTNLANHFKTRGEAFNYARKQGWKIFTYDDGKGKYKQFTTELEVPASGTAKQQGQQSQNPQTETQEQGQSTNKNKQFIYLGNRGEPLLNRKFTYSIPNFPILTNDLNLYRSFEGYIPGPNAETDISNQKIENKIPNLKVDSIKDVPSIPIVNSGNSAASTSEPKQYLTIGNHPSFFNKKLITSNRFLNQGLVSPSIFFKQGGTIEKLQTGGWLSKILSRLFTTAPNPNEHRVNENTTTIYEEGTPFIGRPFEKRGITSNGQTSSMYIKNPNTSKADTTFYSPGYSKDPELYPEFTPQDIRSGNKKGRGKESFMRKFQSPEYFPHLKYQQGGAIEDLRINDELKLEALFRYFQAKGVPQENLIDPETGSFNADYEEEATKFFQTVGEDIAFWSAYKSAPDKTILEYVNSENPNMVEMAKKGAKLKQLKKYKKGNPIKKCSCGCDMITSKEAGGKLVSKCACGCKN